MRIKWFAHAAFLIEGDGIRIITDPYTPDLMGFAPITEPADIVIRSSADDAGHANADMIRGDPAVVTTTEILSGPVVVRGCRITAIAAQESLVHKKRPLDNAMYRLTLEGIRIAHFGDVGNRLTDEQLDALAGAEVVLVPAGGPPTIDLQDLQDAVQTLRPRITIPMHYALPGCKVKMLPVSDLVERFRGCKVEWCQGPEIVLKASALPADHTILILQPSTAQESKG
jgi:L-ascorbate metabolism protein UlaG (beta-lactamase superfamily)